MNYDSITIRLTTRQLSVMPHVTTAAAQSMLPIYAPTSAWKSMWFHILSLKTRKWPFKWQSLETSNGKANVACKQVLWILDVQLLIQFKRSIHLEDRVNSTRVWHNRRSCDCVMCMNVQTQHSIPQKNDFIVYFIILTELTVSLKKLLPSAKNRCPN